MALIKIPREHFKKSYKVSCKLSDKKAHADYLKLIMIAQIMYTEKITAHTHTYTYSVHTVSHITCLFFLCGWLLFHILLVMVFVICFYRVLNLMKNYLLI